MERTWIRCNTCKRTWNLIKNNLLNRTFKRAYGNVYNVKYNRRNWVLTENNKRSEGEEEEVIAYRRLIRLVWESSIYRKKKLGEYEKRGVIFKLYDLYYWGKFSKRNIMDENFERCVWKSVCHKFGHLFHKILVSGV